MDRAGQWTMDMFEKCVGNIQYLYNTYPSVVDKSVEDGWFLHLDAVHQSPVLAQQRPLNVGKGKTVSFNTVLKVDNFLFQCVFLFLNAYPFFDTYFPQKTISGRMGEGFEYSIVDSKLCESLHCCLLRCSLLCATFLRDMSWRVELNSLVIIVGFCYRVKENIFKDLLLCNVIYFYKSQLFSFSPL